MTKRCFYCNDVLSEAHFLLDKATMIMPQTYAHTDCIDGLRDGSITGMTCHYCDKPVSQSELVSDKAVKIGRDRYAHVDCIDSHGKENTMNDETQHILGAADSAHQGIELAISLIQESLGNMGEILTQGCMELEPASLGATMRLGQNLKESSFMLGDLLNDARGLCVLLGKDLGVCEDEVVVLSPGPESPSDSSEYRHDMFGETLGEMVGEPRGTPDYRDLLFAPDDDDLEPGEDEFDDDEAPF